MNMKSKLNIVDFKKLLLKKTKQGNPYILFTPLAVFYLLDRDNKTYLGRLDKDSFELTLKSPLFPTPYIIKGHYELMNETEANVEYSINPVRFVFWISLIVKVIIPIIVLFVSSIIYTQKGFCISLIILVVISSWITKTMKNQMEIDFQKTFKINAS
jgi:hypothetical protein